MHRKIIGLACICILLNCLGADAWAEFRPTGIKESCYMKINAYCDHRKRFVDGKNWSYKDKGYDNHTVFVRHYVPHGTTPYTNLFRIRKVDSEGNTVDTVGGKWCEPKLNIPITSDEIVMNEYYSVTARGNTLHYDKEHVEKVELRVNMYVNMNVYPKEKAPITDDDLDHAMFD